jgi:capsular polysaccharide biosynthesis protein
VCCESLSVPEQIKPLFPGRGLLGVHGAGLTNIVFSPPGSRVIELSPEGTDWTGNAIYRTLAGLRGQPLLQLVCGLQAASDSLPLAHRDIRVDTPHLDSLLRDMLV